MSTSYCRIDGIIARNSNQAILFRRGPKINCQMLLWNFETDVVTPGQWLVKKLNTLLCEITDDAEFAIVSASLTQSSIAHAQKINSFNKPSDSKPMWISVSRPPYFSALYTWETYFNWREPLKKASSKYSTQSKDIVREDIILLANRVNQGKFSERFTSRGWIEQPPNDTLNIAFKFRKQFPSGRIEIEFSGSSFRATIADTSGTIHHEIGPLPCNFNFIDIDNSGRLVYADKGCLYAWKDFPEGKLTLIADLNPNTFENIPPPDWALKP